MAFYSPADSAKMGNKISAANQKNEKMNSPANHLQKSPRPAYPRTVPTYTEDYGPKASGIRPSHKTTIKETYRNNPHPSEQFMVWRLPNHFSSQIEGQGELLKESEMDNLLNSQDYLKSTYQDDYTGLQQGKRMLPPLSTKPICLPQLSPKRVSEMRQSYQSPQKTSHLKGNTHRYGCSVNFVKAASGVVPTIPPNTTPTSYQTWYSNEFSRGGGEGGAAGGGGKTHNRPPTPIYPLRLPPILKRSQLTAEMSQLTKVQASPKASPRGKGKGRKSVGSAVKPQGSPRRQAGLSWLSEWAGPM